MKFLMGHAFGQNYTLPLPLWLFLFSSAAVVILSFVVFALFIDSKGDTKNTKSKWHNATVISVIGKIISILLLFISVTSDWTNQGALGISVTLFWIILLLGLTYTTAFFGNIWELINPFRAIIEVGEILSHRKLSPLFKYPAQMSYFPALITYYGIIWLELLSSGFGVHPYNLSRLLFCYSVATLIFICYFGKEAWFKYGEFFSVFFRQVSRLSPVKIKDSKIMFKKPFAQLVDTETKSFSLLLFIAFMLASTGFDSLRETTPFKNLSASLPHSITNHYLLYQSVCLALSPFIILAAYFIVFWLVKKLVNTPLTTLDLAKKFAYSLIPIAVAYNAAHYFSLLFFEAPAMLGYLLDPFDLGWSNVNININPISASKVWYMQIFLIVLGHVIAVYVAHKIALKTFKNRDLALKSQYLILMLMVLYTMGSLWIISQPLIPRQ
jgi:hypothetical protein